MLHTIKLKNLLNYFFSVFFIFEVTCTRIHHLLIQEDSDVADERKKVAAITSSTESDAVVIKQLVKVIQLSCKDIIITIC